MFTSPRITAALRIVVGLSLGDVGLDRVFDVAALAVLLVESVRAAAPHRAAA